MTDDRAWARVAELEADVAALTRSHAALREAFGAFVEGTAVQFGDVRSRIAVVEDAERVTSSSLQALASIVKTKPKDK